MFALSRYFFVNILVFMLLFMVLIFLCPIENLEALDWKLEHSAGTNFLYYFDDHDGGLNECGFLPPDYSPLSPVNSSVWSGSPLGKELGTASGKTRNLGNGWGSVEMEFFYQFSAEAPVLTGESFLTEGNNLKFTVKPVLTPISAHLENRVYFTPVAFLVLIGGIDMGTGWRLDLLNLEGLALNNADDVTDVTRSGLYTAAYLALRLQFDFAAVFPGEYSHVVLRVDSGVNFIDNSSARDNEDWYWRGDRGQNFNGWKYLGDYLVGWLPPKGKLKFIGFRIEHSTNAFEIWDTSKVSDGGWGSDFHKLRFGPLVSLDPVENHILTLLVQFHNGVYYDEETSYARWFQRWEATGETYIKLERIVLAYTWKF